MIYQISYTCLSHVGKYRRANQDNYLCHQKHRSIQDLCPETIHGKKTTLTSSLFGVFDGIGGLRNGDTASRLAAEEAKRIKIGLSPLDRLYAFCQKVNSRICDHHDYPMGTTASLLAFKKNRAYLCHIGDSKIYRLRDGQLSKLTQDHLMPGAYGTKPSLYQYLGIPSEESNLEPQLSQFHVQRGDMYLICSDGLTDMLLDEQIAQILSGEDPAQRLLEEALTQGGRDNITLILCEIN